MALHSSNTSSLTLPIIPSHHLNLITDVTYHSSDTPPGLQLSASILNSIYAIYKAPNVPAITSRIVARPEPYTDILYTTEPQMLPGSSVLTTLKLALVYSKMLVQATEAPQWPGHLKAFVTDINSARDHKRQLIAIAQIDNLRPIPHPRISIIDHEQRFMRCFLRPFFYFLQHRTTDIVTDDPLFSVSDFPVEFQWDCGPEASSRYDGIYFRLFETAGPRSSYRVRLRWDLVIRALLSWVGAAARLIPSTISPKVTFRDGTIILGEMEVVFREGDSAIGDVVTTA
ncbi:MAG: hypothetical protein Q9218_008280 [Villophora microphyllina]